MGRVLVGILAIVVFFLGPFMSSYVWVVFHKRAAISGHFGIKLLLRSSQLLRKFPSLWEVGPPFLACHGNLHCPYYPEITNLPKQVHPLLQLFWSCNWSRCIGTYLPQATEFVFWKQHMICETYMYTLHQNNKWANGMNMVSGNSSHNQDNWWGMDSEHRSTL